MENVAYAVHTRSCTFLLDRDGLCHWIVARHGGVPPDIRGCVGAQFVASLHPELDGLLAGELLLGAAALFVKHDPESGKLVLIRTGEIVHVEDRAAARPSSPPRPLSDDTLDLSGTPFAPPPPPTSRGGDTIPPPAWVPSRADDREPSYPGFAVSHGVEIEELDVSPDPESYPGHAAPPVEAAGESTITLTLPLFRGHGRLPER